MQKKSGRDQRTKVCLFAKAPVLGQVKTRMAGHLSENDCLQLHTDMLMCVATMVAQLSRQDFQFELHITAKHPYFDALSGRHNIPQVLQNGEGLGARMSCAVQKALADFESVLLVGADCPLVDVSAINAARATLVHCNAAMIPALDGGYVALGLRSYDACLFSGIAWGGADVAATTVQRMKSLSWDYQLLAACPDIDRPEDLRHLAVLPALAHWALRAPLK
jgi:rSAM/selenodomain-associated transferase 1